MLVLSQYVEKEYAAELLAESAEGVGYLLKDRVADLERFIDAVRRVAEGGSVLDPEVVSQMLARRSAGPLDQLTPREREVLALMAEGRSNSLDRDRDGRHRARGREARDQHLRQARSAGDGRRPPAGPCRPRVPEFVTAGVARHLRMANGVATRIYRGPALDENLLE